MILKLSKTVKNGEVCVRPLFIKLIKKFSFYLQIWLRSRNSKECCVNYKCLNKYLQVLYEI